MKKLIISLLAVILMVSSVALAVTPTELADSKLEPQLKFQIASLIASGNQAQADSTFNVAMAKIIQTQAKSELDMAMSKIKAQFKAEVIKYVRPIPTIPAVIDSMDIFVQELNDEHGHLAVDILCNRYQLDAGDAKHGNPRQRLVLMKVAYNERQKLQQEMSKVLRSQLKGANPRLTAMKVDSLVVAVTGLAENQVGMLHLMNTQAATIDSLKVDLATVRTAVDQHGFDIQAALGVLECAKVENRPNPDTQALLRRARQQQQRLAHKD